MDRFLVRPAWPVAQNGQPIPQPACDDTHIVTRSGYFISTDSTSAPSCSRHSILRVAPSSQVSSRSEVSSRGSSSPARAVADAGGQVRHVLGRVGVPCEVVPGQLVGPERLLAERRDGLPPLGQLKIGEMARWSGHCDSVRATF